MPEPRRCADCGRPERRRPTWSKPALRLQKHHDPPRRRMQPGDQGRTRLLCPPCHRLADYLLELADLDARRDTRTAGQESEAM